VWLLRALPWIVVVRDVFSRCGLEWGLVAFFGSLGGEFTFGWSRPCMVFSSQRSYAIRFCLHFLGCPSAFVCSIVGLHDGMFSVQVARFILFPVRLNVCTIFLWDVEYIWAFVRFQGMVFPFLCVGVARSGLVASRSWV